MPISLRILVLGFFLLLLDWYFYQAISVALKDSSANKKNIVFYSYWGFTAFSFVLFLIPTFFQIADWPKFIKVYVFAFVIMLLISKLIGTVFIVADDIIRLFRWIGNFFTKFYSSGSVETIPAEGGISRLKFLNYLALGMAAIPFMSFVYGMVKGAFDIKIHRAKVILPNLPYSFNGLKIVQISDLHLGSFISNSFIKEAVEVILHQQPDIIFFTGDLVNDYATETESFVQVLSKLNAPLGVYSTLGNHDYGDYSNWKSKEAKEKNLQDLKNIHAQMGWRLLLNEHIALKKGDAEIALIGMENWGGNLHFSKYGDMNLAYKGAEKYPVKLLLSHDPSHWNLQVKNDFKDVDLTFSGHTHGAQFGIEIPRFKWSPVQYFYKQWAGLYSEGKQYLYVNRGLGFLGYPGRVGISPEITVMELFKS